MVITMHRRIKITSFLKTVKKVKNEKFRKFNIKYTKIPFENYYHVFLNLVQTVSSNYGIIPF